MINGAAVAMLNDPTNWRQNDYEAQIQAVENKNGEPLLGQESKLRRQAADKIFVRQGKF
jgi:hypothetical protein